MLERSVRAFNPSGLSQRWRMLKKRIYRGQVAFVHVPKCAGTSLSHVLRSRYILSQQRIYESESRAACRDAPEDDWMQFKQRLALYHLNNGINFVQGHFPIDRWTLDNFADDVRFITILRDPVARVISHYHFDSRLYAMPFSDFLDSPRGQIETSVFCRFFGEAGWREQVPDDSVAMALANLERFALVGTLEAPEALRRSLKETFNISVGLPRRNETIREGGGRSSETLSEVDLKRLERLCERDLEIYGAFRADDA